MGRLSELIVKISANSEGFRAQLREANAELLRTQSTVRRQTQGFANLGAGLQSFGGALIGGVTLPLAGVAAAAVKTFGDIDSLKRALFTIEGTAAGTEARFQRLAKAAELPGLGLEQAVRADVRLRAIGLSANLSERAILGFGKALAGAGSGAQDLDETIRQFGQLASASSLTAENLKPIIERVPQAGRLLREAFGSANAEELRKLGVTSQQVVDLLITKLNELPDVSSGIKNSLENLGQSSRLALAEIGKALEPAATSLIGFASSVVSKVPEIVRTFTSLPEPIQTAALAVAGFAGVSGVGIYTAGAILGSFSSIVTGVGAIRTAFQALAASQLVAATAAMFTFQGAVTATSVAMGALTLALNAVPWLAVAASVGVLIQRYLELRAVQQQILGLEDQQRNLQTKIEERLKANGFAVDELKAKLAAKQITLLEYNQAIRAMAVELGSSQQKTQEKTKATGALQQQVQQAATAVEKLANGTGLLNRETLESRVLIAAQNQLLAEQRRNIEELAAARIKLSRGIPQIDFGDVPDILSESNRLPEALRIPIEFPELEALNDAVRAQQEAEKAAKANEAALKKQQQQGRSTGRDVTEAMRQIRQATRQVSNGIADAVFNGGNFGETMGRVARSIGQNLTSFVIGRLIEATGLLKGFDRILTGVIKNAAGTTAQGAIGTVGSSAGAAAGSAGSAAGGAASAATSGALGIVGAVSQGISAISGVISNFQLARQETSLNAIGLHTLQTANDLANLRADQFKRTDENRAQLDSLFQLTYTKLDELITSVRNIGSVSGGGGGGLSVTVNGGLILGQNGVSQLADLLAVEFRARGVFPR